MPNLDGFQATALIRESEDKHGTRRVPIIAVTGWVDDRERCLAAGMDEHLSKPFTRKALRAAILPWLSSPPPPPAPGAIAGRRILLAEDNETMRAVALGMLEGTGVHVDIARDGQEAVEMLGAAAYDLVLMDCDMPTLDGFAATAMIRAAETRGARHLPIVALTADAMAGDRERCLAAGMDDYLSKPFMRETLRATVARWLPLEG